VRNRKQNSIDGRVIGKARKPGVNSEECPVIPLAYRAREAAVALGVSERTLHTLVTNGEIPSFKLDPSSSRSARLFPVSGLKAWIERRMEAPDDGT
jgi:excisionase family DNA binding protein